MSTGYFSGVSNSDLMLLQSPTFQPLSKNSSSEDVSISGTVVLHGKNDESDTPRASKSRLGMLEKASSLSTEDSAANLEQVPYIERTHVYRHLMNYFVANPLLHANDWTLQAKAALQGGLRKGNARERPPVSKQSKDYLENKMTERTTTSVSSRLVYFLAFDAWGCSLHLVFSSKNDVDFSFSLEILVRMLAFRKC